MSMELSETEWFLDSWTSSILRARGSFREWLFLFGKVWGAALHERPLALASSRQYGLVGIEYDFSCARRR
jgi:hypothetical protein